MTNISIVVPFYNPPPNLFFECLQALKKLNMHEVILIDDCSSNPDIVLMAKRSGFIYTKTPAQSGHDGIPFNMGVAIASGDYICRIDADDILLELPKDIDCDLYLFRQDRIKPPIGLTIEELILAPRAMNGLITPKELALRFPRAIDRNVFGDVLFVLQTLHNNAKVSVHPVINYIYNRHTDSIQASHSFFDHRLRHIQTVARFCMLEQIELKLAMQYMNMAYTNMRYGSKAFEMFNKPRSSNLLI